jgi:hypothetical protein
VVQLDFKSPRTMFGGFLFGVIRSELVAAILTKAKNQINLHFLKNHQL